MEKDAHLEIALINYVIPLVLDVGWMEFSSSCRVFLNWKENRVGILLVSEQKARFVFAFIFNPIHNKRFISSGTSLLITFKMYICNSLLFKLNQHLASQYEFLQMHVSNITIGGCNAE